VLGLKSHLAASHGLTYSLAFGPLQVVQINDYQKQRFVEMVISAMFNTISGKHIAVLGFAFKKVLFDESPLPSLQQIWGGQHQLPCSIAPSSVPHPPRTCAP